MVKKKVDSDSDSDCGLTFSRRAVQFKKPEDEEEEVAPVDSKFSRAQTKMVKKKAAVDSEDDEDVENRAVKF